MPADRVLPLEPAIRERLSRLHAEWERDAARAELSRDRFERAVSDTARSAGAAGTFRLDLAAGRLLVPAGGNANG